ncbi:MAG: putative metallopeptidase [Vicinamibacterales bacterium]
MPPLDDSYALLPEAQALVARLVESLSEFGHLSQARVVCVLSQRTPMLHGAPCAAFVARPHVQGPFAPLFDWCIWRLVGDVLEGEEPDFLILVDAAIWPYYDPEERERLIYHELCHIVPKEAEDGSGIRIGRDGRPILTLRPHDAEVFNAELVRYGPEVVGIDDTVHAIVEGQKAAKARRRPRRVG